MREILYNVEPATAPESREASRVEVWIEQVAAVRRGLHERFEGLLGARVEGDIFCDVIGPQAGFEKAWHQERLAIETVRKLLPLDHQPSMGAGRPVQTSVHVERRHTGVAAAQIGEFEELLFGSNVFKGVGGETRHRDSFGRGLRTLTTGGIGNLLCLASMPGPKNDADQQNRKRRRRRKPGSGHGV